MRRPLRASSAVSSGSRMNRRGGETLELAADRFMRSMLAPRAAAFHWPEVQNVDRGRVCSGDRRAAPRRVTQTPSCSWISRATSRAVGAALGLAHHVPHDRADRLGVAVAHALGRVRVGRERGRHDTRELAPRRRSRPGPRRSTIARGLSPLGHEPVEHLARGAHAHLLGGHEPDELRERRGRDPRAGRVRAVVEARHELAGDPVGEQLRGRRRIGAAASAASK